MDSIESIDFFFDQSLVEDPYPYFEALRAECPVLPLPHLGIVAVTGYDEASEVYRDPNTFSSCNSVIGPFATFPVPLEGDDVGAIVDQYRDQLPMAEHMVTMDPPDHTRERAVDAAHHAQAAPRERRLHVASRRPTARRVRRQRSLRVHRRVLPAVRHARGRRPPRRARRRPSPLPRGLRHVGHRRRGGRGRGGATGRQRAQLARPGVRRVHRGSPGESARRRADRPRARHVPGRQHARRDGRGAHVDVPVRGGSGDDRAPAGVGAEAARAASRAAGRVARAPRPHPQLRRGGAAHREPGEDRLLAWRAAPR